MRNSVICVLSLFSFSLLLANAEKPVKIVQSVDTATHTVSYQPAKPAWEASSRARGAFFGMTHVWQVYPVAVQSLDKSSKHLALVIIVKSQGKPAHNGSVLVMIDGQPVKASQSQWGTGGVAYLWETTSTATIRDGSLVRKMAAAEDVRVELVQTNDTLSVKLDRKQMEALRAMVAFYDGLTPRAAH